MAKTPKRPRDPNQLAKLITDIATGETSDAPPPLVPKGRAGGAARAASVSAERRVEIARKASLARWRKAEDQ